MNLIEIARHIRLACARHIRGGRSLLPRENVKTKKNRGTNED